MSTENDRFDNRKMLFLLSFYRYERTIQEDPFVF